MRRTSRLRPRKTAAVMMLTAAVGVSACSAADQDVEAFTIGIAPESTEQNILGAIYGAVLTSVGVDNAVVDYSSEDHSTDIDPLISGEVDMVFTCTGTLLRQLDPQGADETAADLGAESNDVNGAEAASDTVYNYTVGTLPGSVTTVDPSPAQGCGHDPEGEKLPDNIIPVFSKMTLTRAQEIRVNSLTRSLSTKDLAELIDKVDTGETLNSVVSEWAGEHPAILSPADEESTQGDGAKAPPV